MLGQKKVVNGVDVERLGETATALKAEAELAQFRFHARNRWESGGLNHTAIESYHGNGQTYDHAQQFVLHADEPPILLGGDQAANPVEHLLHALASCMTTSMVYHAAARGIEIESVESELEGELDLRGFLGVAEDVRKGYRTIRATFHVRSNGDEEQLMDCASYSPVYDLIRRGTAVNVQMIRI